MIKSANTKRFTKINPHWNKMQHFILQQYNNCYTNASSNRTTFFLQTIQSISIPRLIPISMQRLQIDSITNNILNHTTPPCFLNIPSKCPLTYAPMLYLAFILCRACSVMYTVTGHVGGTPIGLICDFAEISTLGAGQVYADVVGAVVGGVGYAVAVSCVACQCHSRGAAWFEVGSVNILECCGFVN